ncbi:MAG: rhodanese-like domain-containing protein [Halieaceae bacterium]|jgi:rhodanese-related sulfurtransferase|nr:rhodanese-like domain-containing protein [Halieaceae bacterium]
MSPESLKKSAAQLVAEAREEIENVSVEEAQRLLEDPTVLFVDIRDVRELQQQGSIPGAFHAPRGMIEFWVDPDSPYFKPPLAERDRLLLFCQSSWRSALATKALKEMGVSVAHIDGGFKAWQAAGGAVEARDSAGSD